MVELGSINKLSVVKFVDFGAYLDGEIFGEILLPTRYVPERCSVDEILDVFLYLDNEERIIATTQMPYATVGEFALLECTDVSEYGAFMGWGIMKDLFVPFAEQAVRMEKGKYYVVFVYIDSKTERIVGSSKLSQFLDEEPAVYEIGAEVCLFIYGKSDLGYKVIVDNMHDGLIYENEVFTEVKRGHVLKGYIKKVREDGKLDISLYPIGFAAIEGTALDIYKRLQANKGYIALNDKAPSQVIYDSFGISKKLFKKAIGSLYKQKLIVIDEQGISLVQDNI